MKGFLKVFIQVTKQSPLIAKLFISTDQDFYTIPPKEFFRIYFSREDLSRDFALREISKTYIGSPDITVRVVKPPEPGWIKFLREHGIKIVVAILILIGILAFLNVFVFKPRVQPAQQVIEQPKPNQTEPQVGVVIVQ